MSQSRPFFPSRNFAPQVRVNGKIRATEVRLIGEKGEQLGVISLNTALQMSRDKGLDLVEIATNAVPPVCRIIDFGKYKYEQQKKEKDSKKHSHASKLKEIQLRPSIDPHDFEFKLNHAIEFLNDDMKVKIVLRFRGREMAHTEFGKQTVATFIEKTAAYGKADSMPKIVGRSISVIITPLPKNRRPANAEKEHTTAEDLRPKDSQQQPTTPASAPQPSFNNPFGSLKV